MTLRSTRRSGDGWRASMTAAVAPTSESRTKKCQGLKPSLPARSATAAASAFPAEAEEPLIEVAELIVQAGGQRRVVRRSIGGGLALRHRLAARPAQGDEGNPERTGRPGKIRDQPGETVEAFVDRRG